jgi:uncharacterized protein (TIGR03437 family)
MSCKVRIAFLLPLIAGVAFAQVENAADAAAGISVSSPVAPGSQAFVTDFVSGEPPSIGGAAVSIRPIGSSTAIPAQVVNAASQGITFLVPPDVPPGNAQLIFRQSGQLIQWTGITIAPSHLALYRVPVRAVNVNASGPATPNGLANPAQPGQAIEIFGTGLGAMPQAPPQVLLGGIPQKILYAGDASAETGVFQINFQISSGTPDGCYVPLTVIWGAGTASSYLSKTSDGMACHHPFHLSTTALQTLDMGGSVQTGLISMTTALNAPSSSRASRQENAVITFTGFQASEIANHFTPGPAQGCGGASSPGFFAYISGTSLQLGDTMTLQSASTTLKLTDTLFPQYSTTIPPSADAPLNSLPAPVIGGGLWTWSSSGASALPASSFNFNLAPPLQINGGAPVSIQPGQDQTITWYSGGFDSGAILQLSVSANDFAPPSVLCFAPAEAGTLTIPGSALAQFTSGGVGTLSASVYESGAAIPHANFILSDGTPLLMLVIRGSTDTRPVDFK